MAPLLYESTYYGTQGLGTPYLMHHGVKEQEWHKRRYQYKDGSLTPLGRIHYGVGKARDAARKVRDKVRTYEKQEEEKRKRKVITSGNIKQVQKYRSKLTEEEINEAIKNVDMAKQLKDIRRQGHRPIDTANDIMATTITTINNINRLKEGINNFQNIGKLGYGKSKIDQAYAESVKQLARDKTNNKDVDFKDAASIVNAVFNKGKDEKEFKKYADQISEKKQPESKPAEDKKKQKEKPADNKKQPENKQEKKPENKQENKPAEDKKKEKEGFKNFLDNLAERNKQSEGASNDSSNKPQQEKPQQEKPEPEKPKMSDSEFRSAYKKVMKQVEWAARQGNKQNESFEPSKSEPAKSKMSDSEFRSAYKKVMKQVEWAARQTTPETVVKSNGKTKISDLFKSGTEANRTAEKGKDLMATNNLLLDKSIEDVLKK